MSDDQAARQPQDDESGVADDHEPVDERVDERPEQTYEPPPFEPRSYSPPEREPEPERSPPESPAGPESSAAPQSSTVPESSAAPESPAGAESTPPRSSAPTAPPPPGAPSAPPPAAPARDPNVDAIARAGLAPDVDGWLREVAGQVDPRLDRVAPGWRGREQSGVARACVFGLMLGRLANDYPHTSGDLGRVAEAHPSFATLPAGARLATLRELAQDRRRGAQWVAGLVGLEHDPSPLQDILD